MDLDPVAVTDQAKQDQGDQVGAGPTRQVERRYRRQRAFRRGRQQRSEAIPHVGTILRAGSPDKGKDPNLNAIPRQRMLANDGPGGCRLRTLQSRVCWWGFVVVALSGLPSLIGHLVRRRSRVRSLRTNISRSIAIRRRSIAIAKVMIALHPLSIAIQRLMIAFHPLSIVIQRLSIAFQLSPPLVALRSNRYGEKVADAA